MVLTQPPRVEKIKREYIVSQTKLNKKCISIGFFSLMASLIGFKLSVFNPFCSQTHYHNTWSYLLPSLLTAQSAYMLKLVLNSDANCRIMVIAYNFGAELLGSSLRVVGWW